VSYAVAQYRTSQVSTASPAQVIVQFYDGALKFIKRGREALVNKDIPGKGVALSRAHAVVSELRINLDRERAPELCAELDRLYLFILECITEANMKCDPKLLDGAIKVLEQLRAAWSEVAENPTAVRQTGTSQVVITGQAAK
jgi:flagellar secretion chaperone FliS